MMERPEGREDRIDLHRHDHLHLAGVAGAAITELRVQGVRADIAAQAFLREVAHSPVRIIANRPDSGLPDEYEHKLREAQDSHHLPPETRVLFVEGQIVGRLRIQRSAQRAWRRRRQTITSFAARARPFRMPLPRCCCSYGMRPVRFRTRYSGWTEGNPIAYLLKFLAFGEGDTAPVTREVLRQAEPDPKLRPRIHVG